MPQGKCSHNNSEIIEVYVAKDLGTRRVEKVETRYPNKRFRGFFRDLEAILEKWDVKLNDKDFKHSERFDDFVNCSLINKYYFKIGKKSQKHDTIEEILVRMLKNREEEEISPFDSYFNNLKTK